MTYTAIDPMLAWLTAEDLREGRTVAAELAEISAYLDETGIDLGLVLDFVTGPFARLYVRQVSDCSDATWCPSWWYHLEAIERFGVLRAARNAIDDAADLSSWWLAYVEPHMETLMGYRGPFHGCSIRNGHRSRWGDRGLGLWKMPTTLPTTPRPAALAVA